MTKGIDENATNRALQSEIKRNLTFFYRAMLIHSQLDLKNLPTAARLPNCPTSWCSQLSIGCTGGRPLLKVQGSQQQSKRRSSVVVDMYCNNCQRTSNEMQKLLKSLDILQYTSTAASRRCALGARSALLYYCCRQQAYAYIPLIRQTRHQDFKHKQH